jgi:hypothetical protein
MEEFTKDDWLEIYMALYYAIRYYEKSQQPGYYLQPELREANAKSLEACVRLQKRIRALSETEIK